MPDRPLFRFLVVNDLHHAAPECTPFLERLVAQMHTHGPVDFCLVVGDLADAGLEASLVSVRTTFAGLRMPVYAVPGNHDCDTTWDTSLYAKCFPDRLNYQFSHRGWQFIGLDSTDGNAWHDTRVGDPTLRYLDQTVPHLDRDAPTVVFTHFPLAPVPRLTPLNATAVLARFDALNLRSVLCGHYHAHTASEHRKAIIATHPCCSRVRHNHDGTLPEGYVLCSAHRDGRLERQFIGFAEASRADKPPAPGA